MSFIKNIKSLFIAEEGSPEQNAEGILAENAPEVKATVSPIPLPNPAPRIIISNNSAGEVSEKFTQILLKALEDNNIGGFDYLEFKQSLLSLAKMSMDEPTRFQAAFSMAQTMGASSQKLQETATQYLGVLQREQQKFQETLVTQRANLIGNREQQLTQLEQNIKNKLAQIDNLTKEIEQNKTTMEALRKEIAESSVKVETAGNNFTASYENIVNQINTDLKSMQLYLK